MLCTLSMSGHENLAADFAHTFPTVLIDEACQSVELSTLIPLQYGASRCILVGGRIPFCVDNRVATLAHNAITHWCTIFTQIPTNCHRQSFHKTPKSFPTSKAYLCDK